MEKKNVPHSDKQIFPHSSHHCYCCGKSGTQKPTHNRKSRQNFSKYVQHTATAILYHFCHKVKHN